jgi:hypothetical protein
MAVARLTFIDVARIVFDARAHAEFLQGIPCPDGSASRGVRPRGVCLGFPEIGEPFLKFGGNADAGFLNPFLGRGVVISRVNRIGLIGMADLAAKAVDLIDRFDFIAKAIDADVVVIRDERGDVDDVAMDAESAGVEIEVVPGVLAFDETFEKFFPVEDLPTRISKRSPRYSSGSRKTINGCDRSHDDRVAPFKNRIDRACAQHFDLVVHHRVLLDVGIGFRDVSLGLVEIEVRDEILHPVLREEFFELAIELRAKGLVMNQNKGRAIEGLNDVGIREGFARSGRA